LGQQQTTSDFNINGKLIFELSLLFVTGYPELLICDVTLDV